MDVAGFPRDKSSPQNGPDATALRHSAAAGLMGRVIRAMFRAVNGYEQAPDSFRAILEEHDHRVLLVAALTAVGVVGAWIAVYFVAHWLVLLVATAAQGEAATLPHNLPELFLVVALALCAVAWVSKAGIRTLSPTDRVAGWRQVLDLLLALPRMTVSIFGTLGARTHLRERDLDVAWFLLRETVEADGMDIASFSALLPNRRKARHLGLMLQMAGLLQMEKEEEGFLIKPTGVAERLLTGGNTVRFHAPSR
jgi:hypothetical protein